MKIAEIAIENCKSYRELEKFSLDSKFNILVGPNGGGKSNTLDILTIAIRRFFLKEYSIVDREERSVLYRDIEQASPFNDVRYFLEPNLDRPNDLVKIDLLFRAGRSDVENIAVLKQKRDRFSEAANKFRNFPIQVEAVVADLEKASIGIDQAFHFQIVGTSVTHAQDESTLRFLQYLETINFFLLLSAEGEIPGLKPCFAYFSPYRSANAQDLRANLSSENFRGQLAQYANSSSHGPVSLLRLAALFFAEKMRSLETRAKEKGYADAWREDDAVKKVSGYLSQLGYKWELVVVNRNRNIYDIRLEREAKIFSIDQASSGEKEILTFILGLFALQTAGGLVVIDEPEVHLHPRWQALLRDVLSELSEDTGNQLVVSTHSPMFITPSNIGSVRRVHRANGATTRVIGGLEQQQGSAANWHILNSHNNERTFFADKVVLVEGPTDRVLFEALIASRAKSSGSREVIEVVEVHGKGNFSPYESLLKRLAVETHSVADRDYAVQLGGAEIAVLFEKNQRGVDRNVLRNKKSNDRVALAEILSQAIQSSDLTKLKEIWSYIEGRHLQLRGNLNEEERAKLETAFLNWHMQRIHVLRRGEIEDYLPLESRSLEGVIRLVRPENFESWTKNSAGDAGFQELTKIVDAIVFGTSPA